MLLGSLMEQHQAFQEEYQAVKQEYPILKQDYLSLKENEWSVASRQWAGQLAEEVNPRRMAGESQIQSFVSMQITFQPAWRRAEYVLTCNGRRSRQCRAHGTALSVPGREWGGCFRTPCRGPSSITKILREFVFYSDATFVTVTSFFTFEMIAQSLSSDQSRTLWRISLAISSHLGYSVWPVSADNTTPSWH